ncbi:hypothetical protein [Ruegeria conchae]|uniref:hypothetical protein n=1 Tax=Ruegeria conchae TaxID=981384 RepID=UPI0029C899CF|nr:hypothetical protein [Ruegeria conchae]
MQSPQLHNSKRSKSVQKFLQGNYPEQCRFFDFSPPKDIPIEPWWPDKTRGGNRNTDYNQDYESRLLKLDTFLEELFQVEFPPDHKLKLAVLMYDRIGPRFELRSKEIDRGRQTEALKGLKTAKNHIEKSMTTLRALPNPVNLHAKHALSYDQYEGIIAEIDRLILFYEHQKSLANSRANERANKLAILLKFGYELYTDIPCIVTQCPIAFEVTSEFALGVQKLFRHLGLEGNAFEPARVAKHCNDGERIHEIYMLAAMFFSEKDLCLTL